MWTLDSLRAAAAKGEPFEYLFFWGHRQKKPGTPDASCLSQWFPAPFTVDGERFPTAEHFMMAGKARLFGDEATRARILATEGPDAAKELGREVSNYVDGAWAAARHALVVAGNVHKFSQHEPLARFLLATGDRVLVEASPTDRIWGIGLAKSAPNVTDPSTWRGTNLLGFALMEVRDRLRGR